MRKEQGMCGQSCGIILLSSPALMVFSILSKFLPKRRGFPVILLSCHSAIDILLEPGVRTFAFSQQNLIF